LISCAFVERAALTRAQRAIARAFTPDRPLRGPPA
jgi:hypothetical protein